VDSNHSLLSFDPNATLFCCNGSIWLQQGVLSQPFALFVAIGGIFYYTNHFMALSMKIVAISYHCCHDLSCVANSFIGVAIII
jgi:hypothetical protein